jgi:hypothetical protein
LKRGGKRVRGDGAPRWRRLSPGDAGEGVPHTEGGEFIPHSVERGPTRVAVRRLRNALQDGEAPIAQIEVVDLERCLRRSLGRSSSRRLDGRLVGGRSAEGCLGGRGSAEALVAPEAEESELEPALQVLPGEG